MQYFILFAILAGSSAIYTSLPLAAAAITGALVFGSLWFWLLTALTTVLLFTFIDDDDGVMATGTLLAFLLLMQYFGDFKVFSYIRMQPFDTIKWTIAYLIIGTLWSIVKWWFYVRNERDRYDEMKADFLKGRDVTGTTIPAALKVVWQDRAPAKPSAARSKDKIIRWMSFWPWSAIWTIINDPIKKLFKTIYRNIQNLLQKIADSAWEGTQADLK